MREVIIPVRQWQLQISASRTELVLLVVSRSLARGCCRVVWLCRGSCRPLSVSFADVSEIGSPQPEAPTSLSELFKLASCRDYTLDVRVYSDPRQYVSGGPWSGSRLLSLVSRRRPNRMEEPTRKAFQFDLNCALECFANDWRVVTLAPLVPTWS